MAAAFLITFRETLEASLVIVVVLAVLDRMRSPGFRFALWNGVAAGLAASLIVAVVLQWMIGGLTERAEEIAEGVTMLAAAALITWMILWMGRMGPRLRERLDAEAVGHVDRRSAFGIFLMSFLAVLREGTETVLFLQASVLHSQEALQEIGAVAGIVLALGLSFLLLKRLRVLPIRRVFQVTSVLLIFFAAGLIGHGLHALQESGVIAVGTTILWDINPPLLPDGTYPLLHDHGVIGGTLRALLGYNGDPTSLEVGAYSSYLIGVLSIMSLLKLQRVTQGS
jgi:high-affinity iron transporter